jgi:F0F1-type ATP synthase membrane subunit b/b'
MAERKKASMGFADDIRGVLEIEREGKKRLAAAREEAQRALDLARDESRRILEEGELSLARQREKRTEAVQAEIAGEVETLEWRFRSESDRLSHLARQNHDAAVRKILAWLWGEN